MNAITDFIKQGGGRVLVVLTAVGFSGAIALTDASQRGGFMELAKLGLAGYLGSLVPKPSPGDSIQPTHQLQTFDVLVKIGNDERQFTMTVKIAPVAGHEIQVTNGDEDFLETFRYNPMVGLEISKLVSQVYNDKPIQLPANIGDFQPVEVDRAK